MIQIESRLTKARVEPVDKQGENGARLVHKRIRFLAALSFFITSQSCQVFFFRSTMIQNAGLRPLNIFARLRGLGILVIGRVWGECHKRMRESCNCLLFSNLPGVIFLDSTTSTVDQQLVEVLNRVLSHLQVTQEQRWWFDHQNKFSTSSSTQDQLWPFFWILPSTTKICDNS